MKKKLIGIVLVIAMMFSLSITALADEFYYYEEEQVQCPCGHIWCAAILPNAEISPTYDGPPGAGYTQVEQGTINWNDWLFGVYIDDNFDIIPELSGLVWWLNDLQDAQDVWDGSANFYDPSVNAIMQIGMFALDGGGTAPLTFSFSSPYLSSGDIVTIVRYIVDGDGWEFLGEATYVDGEWFFTVEDFGLWAMFFALIQYFIDQGMPPGDAVIEAGRVLGETSPATGDSTLSMIAIALVALSALGLATFSVAKARKEMI